MRKFAEKIFGGRWKRFRDVGGCNPVRFRSKRMCGEGCGKRGIGEKFLSIVNVVDLAKGIMNDSR